MDHIAVGVHDVHIHCAERSGLSDQPTGQQGVGSQKVLDAPWVQVTEGVVGGERILDLLHLPRRCEDRLPPGHCGNLSLGQLVALDLGRGMNGVETVGPPQLQASTRQFLNRTGPAEQL